MASIASSARSVARAAALRGAARNLGADAKAARCPSPRSPLQGQRTPAAPRLLRRYLPNTQSLKTSYLPYPTPLLASPLLSSRTSLFEVTQKRSPVELSCCVETLLPMHSATATALMTSMLSVSLRGYGRLSEGL